MHTADEGVDGGVRVKITPAGAIGHDNEDFTLTPGFAGTDLSMPPHVVGGGPSPVSVSTSVYDDPIRDSTQRT